MQGGSTRTYEASSARSLSRLWREDFALYPLDTCKASTDVKRAGKNLSTTPRDARCEKRGDLRTKDGRIWAASDDTMRLAKAHQQMKKIGVAGKPSRLAFTTARMRQQEANKKLVPMIWKWRASTSCEAIGTP